jgi:hypothetical protein
MAIMLVVMGVSVGYWRKCYLKTLVNSAASDPGSVVLAPIQKIGLAASRKRPAESFRGGLLTSAFDITNGRNGGRYSPIATRNNYPLNNTKHCPYGS